MACLRKRYALQVVVAGIVLSTYGCESGTGLLEPTSTQTRACLSAVLAEIEGFGLDACDVDRYANWQLELGKENGLEAQNDKHFERRLESAINLLALSVLGNKTISGSWVADQKRRLMVRVYLERLFASMQELAVSAQEIDQAHREEIEKFQATGESDIYQPTTVDAAVIMVGYFPDLHTPQDGEIPVVDQARIEQVVRDMQAALGEHVADLDDFLTLARGFMRGNPTVQVKEYAGLALALDDGRIEPRLKNTILSLQKNGDISRPVWFSAGVYMVRKGVVREGKGEKVSEIESELRQMVRLQKMETVYQRQISRLMKKYKARLWPDRLERRVATEGSAR